MMRKITNCFVQEVETNTEASMVVIECCYPINELRYSRYPTNQFSPSNIKWRSPNQSSPLKSNWRSPNKENKQPTQRQPKNSLASNGLPTRCAICEFQPLSTILPRQRQTRVKNFHRQMRLRCIKMTTIIQTN